MNVFQLVSKQMRQRALSTWLTLLSIMLGVALAVAIMILRREGQNLFGQTDFGYDVLIGPPKGSPLQLTLNTAYHMDVSPGVIPYQIYEDMARKTKPLPGHPDYRPYVKTAVPFMVGDSYNGRRIVGTSPQMFGFDDEGKPVNGEPFHYRLDKGFELAEGRAFAPRKFEAVIGSDVAEHFHMGVYDNKLSPEENLKENRAFRATHGFPGPNEKPDVHKPKWRVVGILKQTHTANDRVLFIPFISLYAIAEHESGLIDQALAKNNIDPARIPPERLDEVLSRLGIDPSKVPESLKAKFRMRAAANAPATQPAKSEDVGELLKDATIAPAPAADEGEDPEVYKLDADGNIVPDLPKEEWLISAILVKARGGFQAQQIMYNFKVIDDRATAINPASVMREFFETFLSGSTQVLLLIACLVTIVAAISIMTTIYNSVSARRREIAILRALGATRNKILSLICVEACIVGFLGAIAGFVVGHLLSAAGSAYLNQAIGEGFNWLRVGPEEAIYLVSVVIIAFFAGLVPAMKAYRVSVAANLVAG